MANKVILRRVALSLLATVLSDATSLWWQQRYWVDLNPPLCAARLLLGGGSPYSACYTVYTGGVPAATYPMTTILAFAPFALLPGNLGAAAIWGLFNGLLVYGLLVNGKPWQFLVFLSAPYWIAFTFHQLSVLMSAILLLPSLLPLALIKPQTGLPIILINLTWRRLLALVMFISLAFIVYPGWPLAWYAQAKNYDGVIPLLALPLGPLMLLALLKWREKDMRFLFLMACVPQRALYDLTPLYLLPKSLRQMLAACFLSWAAFVPLLAANYYWGSPPRQVFLSLAFVYLPLLAMQFIPTLAAKLNRAEGA